MDEQEYIMQLERKNTELNRRLKAREATIASQAAQLESATDKARDIEIMVIKLGQELAS